MVACRETSRGATPPGNAAPCELQNGTLRRRIDQESEIRLHVGSLVVPLEEESLSAKPRTPQISQGVAIERAVLRKNVFDTPMSRVLRHKVLVVDH